MVDVMVVVLVVNEYEAMDDVVDDDNVDAELDSEEEDVEEEIEEMDERDDVIVTANRLLSILMPFS